MRLLDCLLGRFRRSRGQARPAPRKHTPALGVEQLESRTVMDAASNITFVSKAYVDLLNRPADPAGLVYFVDHLNKGVDTTRLSVSLTLQGSPEGRAIEVQTAYIKFLHRFADPAGANLFSSFLAAGGTIEQLDAALISTPEYFITRGGGTNPGFVNALYMDTLNRPADPGAQFAINFALARGASRAQVASMILGSTEYQQDLVQSLFQKFLHRGADPGGLLAFTQAVKQGVRDQAIIGILMSSSEYTPTALDAPTTRPTPATPTNLLSAADVGQLLQRAAAASPTNDGIIAIVDRAGRPLGVRVESQAQANLGVSINPTTGAVTELVPGNGGIARLTFAIDGALAEARTGAFFGNNQAPLTSRTIQFISQSAITQREVNSSPDVADVNSPLRGPGFVAAIGTKSHFPPNVQFTPQVDLSQIEHTNRDTTFHPAVDGLIHLDPAYKLPERFNANPAFVPAGSALPAPDSYGYVSGIDATGEPRGIGTLPGGIPIYQTGPMPGDPLNLVGGIGVFFPGTTGYASEENSSLNVNFDPAKPDRSLEAEYIAFAALGGSTGAGARIGVLGGVLPVRGVDLPFGRIDLVGITLDIFGPGGTQGVKNLLTYAQLLHPGTGDPNNGANALLLTDGPGTAAVPGNLRAGQAVAEGWLVLPHAGLGITAQDVVRMVQQGIAQADQTRAAIRLPLESKAKMVFAVTDTTGELLGLYRMPDATIFSIDVAVAKARNVAYYANQNLVQPLDRRDVLGPNGMLSFPPGVAITNRTIRYLAEPRFPEGIDGQPPGPFSQLNDGGVNAGNGLEVGPPLPPTAFQSVLGHDSFFPQTNFHETNAFLGADAATQLKMTLNQNGIVFFPGSMPVYKSINGLPILFGGFGVSGDGVDQDDVVTFGGSQGYQAPGNLRADQFSVRGVRLPFQKFNRNPEG